LPPPARPRRIGDRGGAGGSGRLTRAPRLHPDLRRAMLLDAAEALLVEHDPLTLSLEQVAAEAGTSRPLVHTYFGDRRGLLDALQVRVVRRLSEWVEHGLGRARSTEEALNAMVTAVFSFVDQERDTWRFLSTSGGLDHP